MNYSEIESLPYMVFTEPENFLTNYDYLHVENGHNQEKYNEGLVTGLEYRNIFINYKGVWSALTHSGKMCQSYEGIGYHASTAFLLMGFWDSGANIYVERGSGKDRRWYTLREE